MTGGAQDSGVLPDGCPACGALPIDWAGGANPHAFCTTPAPAGWQEDMSLAPQDGTQILAELQAGYFDVISFWASSWRENANGLALRNPPLRWTAIPTAPAEGGV